MITHSANVIDTCPRRYISGIRAAGLAIGLLVASGVAHAQTRLDVLTAFGPTDPQAPVAPLVQGRDGNFYGTTPQGGASNAGAVFQVTPAGVLTLLYSFTGAGDGAYPYAGLIQGTDGNFYGTTSQGGGANAGTVFQVTPVGTLTVLYSFAGTDGAYPYGGLIQGTDSSFYGTTSQGGASGAGTIFQLSPLGTLSVLYSFTGSTDGAYPYAGLIQGSDGNFYGTTLQGGASGVGTVFQLTPAALTVLYSFTGGTDGAFPYASLLQGTDGNFYGTTFQGGASNFGTAFQMTPTGSLTVLHGFAGGTDGAYPFAGLVQGTDGNFYGTTASGGISSVGTVFLLTPTGAGTVLYSFTGGADGAYPVASLIQATNGSFYGTAQSGGDFGNGLVFQFASTSPPITWSTPAPILYGTRLSDAQLNATSSVPGTFVYTPSAGTLLHAGLQTLTVTFTPSDTTLYTTTSRTVTLVVTPVTPVITWRTPAAIAFGTPLGRSQLNATANVPGTFFYTPGTGEVLAAGSQTLSATFTPRTTDYTAAEAAVTLTVTPATPVISWSPPAIAYGTALSTRELNATANTAGTFVYSPPVGTVLGLGSQTLSATFTPTDTADYTPTAVSATLTVAIPAPSGGGGNEYALQFTPAAGARGLVVAGYRLVADPVQGDLVVGNCSYYTVHSGSGRGGGYKTYKTYYNQTCTWDLYGNLLTVTPGAPVVPSPISVNGTQTIYASNQTGVYTGTDSALPFAGFVYTPGSHYSWLTPNPYAVLQQAVSTVTVTLKSDGDMPLNVWSAQASTLTGKATVLSTTCGVNVSVGSTCAVTVTYDPTGLQSPTGLAYDTLDIHVTSDAGQVHDFVQRYTIVLTPNNTVD